MGEESNLGSSSVVQFQYGKMSDEFLKTGVEMRDATEESISGLGWNTLLPRQSERTRLEGWLEKVLPTTES